MMHQSMLVFQCEVSTSVSRTINWLFCRLYRTIISSNIVSKFSFVFIGTCGIKDLRALLLVSHSFK